MESRIIKKYDNRKLYDTLEKKYTTIDKIITLIKNDTELSIIDNKTNLDITNIILKKCIYDTNISNNVLINLIKGINCENRS